MNTLLDALTIARLLVRCLVWWPVLWVADRVKPEKEEV